MLMTPAWSEWAKMQKFSGVTDISASVCESESETDILSVDTI